MNTGARNLPAWIRSLRKPRQAPAPETRTVVLAALVVGLVAAIAGIVSYSHITALGLRTHQGWADSHLLAVPIDGLIVAGSVILLAGYWMGWLCVIAGVAGTLFANLEFGLPYGALPAVVSTWPAVAFTVATFVLERWLRSRRTQPAQAAQGVPRDNLDAAIHAMVITELAGNGHSGRSLAKQFALPEKLAHTVRRQVLAGMNGHAPEEVAS
jgi:hypothetical protein